MKQQLLDFLRKQPRWRLLGAAAVIVLCAFWLLGHRKTAEREVTFTVKRGDLNITVLEGGSIEALESQEIRSEIRSAAGTKILKIIEEGYLVTDEDVKNGKILVELDSADIHDRVVQEEISYQSDLASLTDAAQSYEIQRNQNTSDIAAAEQKALFARMDFEKYLGDKTASVVIKRLKLDVVEENAKKLVAGENAEQQMLDAMEKNEAIDATNSASKGTNGPALNTNFIASPFLMTNAPIATINLDIDFSEYAREDLLGDGSAMQDLRKNKDDLQTSKQQFGLAETKLNGTKRLFDKGFATKTELDTDQVSYDGCQLRVKTSETALNLFIKYEFPKQARDLVSKYAESLQALERQKKEAISKLAQAKAKLKGAESRYQIEANQRKHLQEQLEKCVIRATRPGLVVYGGANTDRWNDNEEIREGALVREWQPLITLPNLQRMAVRVKVHETYIKKISKDLKATIKIDAFPDQPLPGEVIKVGLLPDSQNRWMNPDMKVYQTMVAIHATNSWIKPGMSAKVEIMIKKLPDVICVPLQAVSQSDGRHYCHVVGATTEKREVEIGEFNDEFIEITKGLKPGEKVSLRIADADVTPSGARPDAKGAREKGGAKPEKPAAPPQGKA
jgi:RND family efflux transporter MFP subunit